MNKKIASSLEFIETSIKEQKPIDWICKQINISRDTFRKYFSDYRGNQGYNVERTEKFGIIGNETRICEKCGKEFIIEGRINSKSFSKKKFCSISCAKARDNFWEKNISHYTTICWKYHKKECIICGENKIVAVHHYDENHNNNDPINLIPLCPTHHCYVHSKYKNLIFDKINEYINNFKGLGNA
jgi:hypothetical protein